MWKDSSGIQEDIETGYQLIEPGRIPFTDHRGPWALLVAVAAFVVVCAVPITIVGRRRAFPSLWLNVLSLPQVRIACSPSG